MIVPTLRVGMHPVTLRVTFSRLNARRLLDAERPERRYHAERGNDRNRDTGGTGLGLAIAQQLTIALGGTLTLTNREGGGLCAQLKLPARMAAGAVKITDL
jgi:signal transduction histidine kinase